MELNIEGSKGKPESLRPHRCFDVINIFAYTAVVMPNPPVMPLHLMQQRQISNSTGIPIIHLYWLRVWHAETWQRIWSWQPNSTLTIRFMSVNRWGGRTFWPSKACGAHHSVLLALYSPIGNWRFFKQSSCTSRKTVARRGTVISSVLNLGRRIWQMLS